MKKKLIALATASCMVACVLASPVASMAAETMDGEENSLNTSITYSDTGSEAESTEVAYSVAGGNIYFDKATGTITRCDKSVTEAVILDEIEGVTVKAIEASAFYWCKNLKKIVLPDSLEYIGSNAFDGCINLQNVKFPGSLTFIGWETFQKCTALTEVILPDGVLEIGQGVFASCTGLEKVSIPGSLKVISNNAFLRCTSLVDVTINNGVEKIDVGAFQECTKLKSISIPGSITEIEDVAFALCNSLENIYLAEGLKTIGTAFEDCSALKTIRLPNSLTDMSMTFANTGLESITILANVVEIDADTFLNCKYLKKVTILNKNTKLWGESPEGDFGTFRGADSVVIYSYPGGTVEAYAKKMNIPFVSLSANSISNAKQKQTITARSFTKTYGNKAFDLEAKAKTKLSYRSSNTKVVTVNSTGKVTLKGPGKATIIITAAATSQYNGATKKITITVKPKKVTGLKAKKGKKRMTVSWKRDTKATGYQITYAQNKKFKKGKKNITISKNKTVKRTIKKLKARKTYYVKVRAYKKVGKTKIYGAYSKVKKVRVR